MNEETHNSTIESELEARIVALVLGEASDFETEELHRLIALRPELAAFHQEMQQVHGLMQIIGAGELETPDSNWKLSAERRESVLVVIRGEAMANEHGASLASVDPGHVALRAESPTRPLPGLSRETDLIAPDPASGVHNASAPAGVPSIQWCKGPQAPGAGPGGDGSTVDSGLNPATTRLTRRLRAMLADSLGPFASSVRRRMRKTPMKIAAGICVAGFIGLMTVPSFFREESSLADSSNHWGYLEDDVAFTESFSERNSASGGTILGFLVPTDASPGPEVAGGEVNEQLLTQLDSANADNAVASTKALSTLQQTLSGGGLAANEADKVASGSGVERELFFYGLLSPGSTDDKNSTRSIAVVPPSSAPEAWFEKPLEERFGNEGRAAVTLGRRSAPVASPDDAVSPELATTWDDNSLHAPSDIKAPAAEGAGVRTDAFDRVPLLAGVTDMPASPEPVAAGDGVDESIPKLMIKSEEESLGKSLSLAVTDSAKTLEDLQASMGESSSPDLGESEDYVSRDKSGYAADGKSDGEQLGRELQKNEALGLSGKADDFGTMARGLSERSDDSGVVRRWAVPGQPGSGGQPESARGGRERISGNTYRSSSESPFEMKDEISEFELTVPESVMESDAKKPGENAKQVEEQAQAKNFARGKSPDVYMGHRFEMDLLDGLQPLAESKSKAAAQPESDFDDDGLKDIVALSKKNESKEQAEEWRKQTSEPESKAKGRNNVFFRQGEAVRSTLADSSELEKKPAAKPVAPSAGLNETSAAAEAFSTFSLHVSDVSFKLAAAALARGEWPEAAKVRIEEFVNAFDYGDPLPGKGEKVACVVEQGIHPFLQQRNVLRVSMRTSAEGRATNTPLRLTFVLDNSGSMERIDRQQTVRRAFTLLSKQLTAIDQVTLFSFSRQPRLLAENVSGTESGKLVELMEQLPSEGGTNIEAALQLAFEKASSQQTPGAQNRIVLLTDGAVNLGNANPESLSQMVESMRAAGIAFDAAGISADGLNDEVLEALTRKGDGRYYLMDSGEAADDNFAQQIAGALRPSASNVKVQVEFNPKRVGQYKLLGFEKHLLKQEDFRNDAVDAAEMAAAEAGVAMYQFEAKPDGEGDVGSVSVRFKDLSTGEMVEHRWPIPYEPEAARPDQTTPSLRIATTAAMLAAKLKGEALGESVDLQTLSQLIDSLPSQNQSQTRVQQLKLMIEQARQMSQQ
jgi:Mg-chelatase subunit ChlD